MRVIGLDIGTTTLCALVLDGGTGEVLHSETVKNDSFLPSPHPWEKLQDPRRRWDWPNPLKRGFPPSAESA